MRIAENLDEIPDRNTLAAQSGLETLQGMISGDIAFSPIGRTLNFRLYSAELGRVAFRGTPEFEQLNLVGGVHGGWYATLLDSATACSIMSKLPKGRLQTTLELKINTIRAIPRGMEVEAVGIAQHVGRTTGVASGEMRGVEDGKLYATASTTCAILTLD